MNVKNMKTKNILLISLIVIFIVVVSPVSFSINSDHIVDGLNSTSDLTQATNDAKIENKNVLLVFDQDNCYYCDVFKKDTLSNHEVQKQLNDEYIIVDLDINQQGSLAAEYQVYGTPTSIFLDSNGNMIHKVEGYVPADEFLNILKEI